MSNSIDPRVRAEHPEPAPEEEVDERPAPRRIAEVEASGADERPDRIRKPEDDQHDPMPLASRRLRIRFHTRVLSSSRLDLIRVLAFAARSNGSVVNLRTSPGDMT